MNLQAARSKASVWWSEKTAAERWLFVTLAIILALTLWWSAVWIPLQRLQNASLRSLGDVETARMLLASLPAQTAQDPAVPTAPDNVRTRITNRAMASGIAIRQINSDGGEVRLTLEPLAFDALVAWLQALSAEDRIEVVEARMERQPEPGIVSAELVMVAR